MKSFAKMLGALLLLCLFVIVALGFALTHWFDPNDYKPQIRDLAREHAHIELTLDGDIGWSLFPWLGLELHDARIASLAAPDQPLADVRLLGLSVKALPLLRKQVEMSDIRVQGLNLHLIRDKAGVGNWQSLGKAPSTSAPSDAPPQEASPSNAPEAPSARQNLSVDIDSLHISDAKIVYTDERTGQSYTAEGISLKTGAIADGRDIPIELDVFIGTNQPVMRSRNRLLATLNFARSTQRYTLNNVELSGEASGEPLSGKTLSYSAQSQIVFDQQQGLAEFKHVKVHANELEALGELRVQNLNDKPELSGALSIARLDLRAFLTGAGQRLPEMADTNTLKDFEFNSLIKGSAKALYFTELSLSLDQSHFSGDIGFTDIGQNALRAHLKADRLNLDRYLAKPSANSQARKAEVTHSIEQAGSQGTTQTPAAPTINAWGNQELIAVHALKKLNLDLNLEVAELTFKSWPFTQAKLQGTAKQGILSVSHASGALYGGSLSLNGQINTNSQPMRLTLQPTVKRIPIERLLKDANNQPPVRGLLDLTADLTGTGNTEQALINSLNGTGQFVLNDGVLVDANLEQPLCRAIATFNRKSLSHSPEARDTPFNALKGSVNIHNGVASNTDLLVKIPGLTLQGNGDIDLRVLGMDYQVGVIVEGDQRAMPDPACQVNKRYQGVAWPLHCRGPLEMGAKACRMDSQGLTQVASKLATDTLSEKIEEKLGDKASPELKDALKKLFNR